VSLDFESAVVFHRLQGKYARRRHGITGHTGLFLLLLFACCQCLPGQAGRFVPITPCRVADTRNSTGAFGGPSIAGGASRDFIIPNGACGVPSTALGYSFNVAVVPAGALAYLTLWPTGQARPGTSTLNSLDGRIKSNAAIVSAGTAGAVSVFASDTTNVILDINGYFVPATDPTALAFYPITPCRIADTRTATGRWEARRWAAGRAARSPSCPAPVICRRRRMPTRST
jgi:hypothetical protein